MSFCSLVMPARAHLQEANRFQVEDARMSGKSTQDSNINDKHPRLTINLRSRENPGSYHDEGSDVKNAPIRRSA